MRIQIEQAEFTKLKQLVSIQKHLEASKVWEKVLNRVKIDIMIERKNFLKGDYNEKENTCIINGNPHSC